MKLNLFMFVQFYGYILCLFFKHWLEYEEFKLYWCLIFGKTAIFRNNYNTFQACSETLVLFIFSGPASKLMFKLCLALWCGIIGSFFTFPGLRFAKMHKDALKYCAERTFLKYGFYVIKF